MPFWSHNGVYFCNGPKIGDGEDSLDVLLNIVSCILEETRMEILPNVPFRNKLTQSAHLSIEYAVMHICTIYFIFIFERWGFSNEHPFRYTASCKSLEDTKRGKDNHDSRIEPPLKKSKQNKIKVWTLCK